MKIVAIFDTRLFSFRFKNEKENELKRLLTVWNDPQYLIKFLTEHQQDAPKESNILQLANQLSEDANTIDDYFHDLAINPKGNFELFFKQLDNNEYQIKDLSKRKGRKNYLRLYAIKIDTNCFVITGGAIKFTHKMQDRKHTQKELQKLDACRQFLKQDGVYDSESFYEFIKEEEL